MKCKCGCEPCHCKERECEAEFRHHLRSTLILLGAPMEIANLLEQTNDRPANGADLHEVMKYNIILATKLKFTLASLPTIKIQSKGNAE